MSERNVILTGDCLDVMATFDAKSIDAIVTDPPYGLDFMGKAWDHGVPGIPFWAEILRVAKPGAHLLAFGGTRTVHRMAVAIEDAGWEIRDTLVWGYAQGFPKSLSPYRSMMGARCRSHERAPHAVQISPWHRLGSPAAKGSTALALAEMLPEGRLVLLIQTGEAGATSAVTATPLSAFPMVATTLSTEWSWSGYSAARWQLTSTSIIETIVGLITDPTTSNFWASLLTPSDTPAPAFRPDGCACDALRVVESLTDGSVSTSSILWPSATEIATAPLAPTKGLGTAAKPAWEPIVMARKPLRGTVAANVQTYGTGALNIDATRIGTTKGVPASPSQMADVRTHGKFGPTPTNTAGWDPNTGRWPANVILTDPIFDGGIEGVEGGGNAKGGGAIHGRPVGGYNEGWPEERTFAGFGDTGTYSRFFLISKASRSDREPVGAVTYCNCETDKLAAWDNEGRSQDAPMATTSPPRATSEGQSVGDYASSTTLFGSESTDLSPTDSTSIIGTSTSRTTTSPTSSLSTPRPTSDSTPAVNSEMAFGGSPAESAGGPSLSTSPTGTSRRKGGRSTVAADLATSPRSSKPSVCGVCGRPLKPSDGRPVEAVDGVTSAARRNSHPT